MAKSISVYDIIHFTLSIVSVGFRGLNVEVQPSRKFDSRKGEFVTPVKIRYGTGTVPCRTVPYQNIYCTIPYDYGKFMIRKWYDMKFNYRKVIFYHLRWAQI